MVKYISSRCSGRRNDVRSTLNEAVSSLHLRAAVVTLISQRAARYAVRIAFSLLYKFNVYPSKSFSVPSMPLISRAAAHFLCEIAQVCEFVPA